MASASIKQETFAQKFVELSNATKAYKSVYAVDKMSDNAIHVEACRLLKNPKVALIVDKLKRAIADKHEITVDLLVLELEEAREMAREQKQSSSMVSATMGKGKLLGFDKVEFNLTGALTITETLAGLDEPDTDEIGEDEATSDKE